MRQHQLLRVGELADGEIRPLQVDGRSVLLVNGQRGPALINRICPQAGDDLAKGTVVGKRIRCPTPKYLYLAFTH